MQNFLRNLRWFFFVESSMAAGLQGQKSSAARCHVLPRHDAAPELPRQPHKLRDDEIREDGD